MLTEHRMGNKKLTMNPVFLCVFPVTFLSFYYYFQKRTAKKRKVYPKIDFASP